MNSGSGIQLFRFGNCFCLSRCHRACASSTRLEDSIEAIFAPFNEEFVSHHLLHDKVWVMQESSICFRVHHSHIYRPRLNSGSVTGLKRRHTVERRTAEGPALAEVRHPRQHTSAVNGVCLIARLPSNAPYPAQLATSFRSSNTFCSAQTIRQRLRPASLVRIALLDRRPKPPAQQWHCGQHASRRPGPPRYDPPHFQRYGQNCSARIASPPIWHSWR